MEQRTSFPLSWPEGRPRTSYRKNARKFDTGNKSFSHFRDDLLDELRRLGATRIILSSNVPLRNDGLPRADAREPIDPGVAIYFDFKQKPMCFACDRFDYVRQNLRAITLTIEAIRGIQRWGSSDMMERAFRGFTALPERASEAWRDVFGFEHNQKVTSDEVETAFRRLAHSAHPDKGGTLDQWQHLCLQRENAMRDLGVTR